jgi:cytosine/adenosine deaminase-related metal-dependent hydrolase
MQKPTEPLSLPEQIYSKIPSGATKLVALYMATINGAKALQLQNEIGTEL